MNTGTAALIAAPSAAQEHNPHQRFIGQSGASALLQTLVEQGVDTIFGYPGGAIMPTYDALSASPLKHIQVRHEENAVLAAQGYARATGKIGVCIVTSGPGALNTITGIADADMDSVPIIVITGQVPSRLLGTKAFQEVDVIGVTSPICKWNSQIRNSNDVPSILERAFEIARHGRPGPVVIDITKDAQAGIIEEPTIYAGSPYSKRAALTTVLGIHRAAQMINDAKRPLMLAGHGVLMSGASDEMIAIAEKGDIPVAVTLHGLSSIPWNHPLYVGLLGMHGNYSPNKLTNEADVIIAVGMRFDDRVTGMLAKYAPHAKVIHIDIDNNELGRLVRPAVSIHADARAALRALVPEIKEQQRRPWHARFAAHHQEEVEAIIAPQLNPDGGKIRMAEAVRALSDITGGKALVTTDVGQHQMATARNFRFTEPGTFITSGGLGTMGFGIPAAIGAAFTNPGKPIIAIVGDGGFQMSIPELQTIAQYQLPITIVVLNNGHLGMVRQQQDVLHGGNRSQVKFSCPDIMKLADAFTLKGIRINERGELKQKLTEAIYSAGPTLVEVVVHEEENVFPMMRPGTGPGEITLS